MKKFKNPPAKSCGGVHLCYNFLLRTAGPQIYNVLLKIKLGVLLRLSVAGMGDEMISRNASLVGKRIKMMRLAKGLQQKYLAERLKISQANM